jgi:aspartate aminotransferase
MSQATTGAQAVTIVADRFRDMAPSATVAATFLAAELKRQGREIISLSVGEPDFATPPHIREAAKAAIDRGAALYAPPNGIPELRDAIRMKFRRENGLDYDDKEIAVGCGAKQLIFNAFLATIEPGDEVVVPSPAWVSFVDAAAMFGARPVSVACPAESGFKLRPQDLEKAITAKTKWLVLGSPSNPSGAVYSDDELGALGEVLRRSPHVWVMTDHIYEHLVYTGRPAKALAQVCPEFRDRGLLVNGVSKSYCMTGWRVGFSAGPRALVATMNAIQSQSVTSTSTISQWAAVTALTGEQEFIARNNDEFRRRRDLVVRMLNEIDGIDCPTPDGAFYVYPSCAGLLGRRTPSGEILSDDGAVVRYLLAEAGVALVHGGAFGLSPHFRLSYATSHELLEQACQQTRAACEALR